MPIKFLVAALSIFSAGMASARSERSISREFESVEASGTVLAMHIGGRQKKVPAKGCAAKWSSYEFDRDPQRANHSLQLSVMNDYGMAFVNSSLPYEIVPPFQSMPETFHRERDSNGQVVEVIDVDGDVYTVETVSRYVDNTDNVIEEDVSTVTLHFDPDFTRVWDMTFKTEKFGVRDGKREPRPSVSTVARCKGEFAITKDEVVDEN